MFQKLADFSKDHALLLITACVFFILVAFFHQILQPFVIAIIVVYLIEPFVTWMNKRHIGKFRIPRGLAVIVTYLLFLATLTGIGFAFIPSLTREISTASEAVPEYFMRVKNEDIPRWSQKLDDIVFTLSRHSHEDIAKAVHTAKLSIDAAADQVQRDMDTLNPPDVDTTGAQPLLVGTRPHPVTTPLAKADDTPVLFQLRESSPGHFDVLPGNREIKLETDAAGTLTLKTTPYNETRPPQSTFNLEREVNRAVTGLLESSTNYAGSALTFLQTAIGFIINTFVQLILVFMLAAFIAIDAPRLMTRIHALFENEEGNATGFDEFKSRLLHGLSGVVRGQLIICCINGTLTGIGLWIFGVDFSLLLGLIAGILSIIPIFGTIISTIPAVLLGLVQSPFTAILVLAWILLVHFLDTNFFTPKIVGSSANLHPVLIIFALLAGEYAAGVLGLILAVPIMSMVQTTLGFILDKTKKSSPKDTQDEPKKHPDELPKPSDEPKKHPDEPKDPPVSTTPAPQAP